MRLLATSSSAIESECNVLTLVESLFSSRESMGSRRLCSILLSSLGRSCPQGQHKRICCAFRHGLPKIYLLYRLILEESSPPVRTGARSQMMAFLLCFLTCSQIRSLAFSRNWVARFDDLISAASSPGWTSMSSFATINSVLSTVLDFCTAPRTLQKTALQQGDPLC